MIYDILPYLARGYPDRAKRTHKMFAYQKWAELSIVESGAWQQGHLN